MLYGTGIKQGYCCSSLLEICCSLTYCTCILIHALLIAYSRNKNPHKIILHSLPNVFQSSKQNYVFTCQLLYVQCLYFIISETLPCSTTHAVQWLHQPLTHLPQLHCYDTARWAEWTHQASSLTHTYQRNCLTTSWNWRRY